MSRQVRRDDQQSRYEMVVDDQVAGFADYVDQADVRMFPHTVTSMKFRGQGIAGDLVKVALDDARAEGKKVVPACSYVADYIDRHPEYADLLR
jgi:predicted GNAT family acetyltransferase